jgi:hypothetical protein
MEVRPSAVAVNLSNMPRNVRGEGAKIMAPRFADRPAGRKKLNDGTQMRSRFRN